MGRFFVSVFMRITETLRSKSRAYDRISGRWPLFLITLVLAVIYWPGLKGEFVFDDFANVVDNPGLQVFDGTLGSLLSAAFSSNASPLGRPLSMATFALNLFTWGSSPFPFKLINLLIHLVNTILVWNITKQLVTRLEHKEFTNSIRFMPIWVAAIWSLHPIQLTSVLFVVQRMTSLSALFVLMGVSFYIAARESRAKGRYLYGGTVFLLFFPCAVLSKETGILLPLFLFLVEWLHLRGFDQIPSRYKKGAVLLVFGVLALVLWQQFETILAGYQMREFTLYERLLTQARVLWLYVYQLILPWPSLFGLFHDDITTSESLIKPISTMYALIGWLLVVTTAVTMRKQHPLFCFAVFWFLAAHTLESTVIPLEMAYEHRNYIASIGIWIWIGSNVFRGINKLKQSRWTQIAAWTFVGLCSIHTGARAAQWGNEYIRTQVELEYHPESARANYQAAQFLVERVLIDNPQNIKIASQVRDYFKRAAYLDASNKASLLGLIYTDCLTTNLLNEQAFEALLQRLNTATFTFADSRVIGRLSEFLIDGMLCLDESQSFGVLGAALTNPRASPSTKAALYAVAMDYTLVRLADPKQALQYARMALENDPRNIAYRINEIYLLVRNNERAEAEQKFILLNAVSIPSRHKASLESLKTDLNKNNG